MRPNPMRPLEYPLAVVVQHEQSMRWPSDLWTHIAILDPTRVIPPQRGLDYYQRLPPGVVGYMVISPEANSERRVSRSVARKGYGPVLYEVALELARDEEWALAPGDSVSPAARKVWRRFIERDDIEARDLVAPDHDAPYLQYAIRLGDPIAGLDDALRRGGDFIAELYDEHGLSEPTAVKAVMASGERLWMDRVEEERKSRAVG